MVTNLSILAETLKGIKLGDEDFTPEKLIEAINSEDEIELQLPEDVQVFIGDELETLKENIGKTAATKGATAVLEQEVKRMRNEHELDFTGKTLPNLMKAYEEKIKSELGMESSEKEEQLKEKIKTLQSNIEALESESTEKIKGYENKLKNKDVNYQLYNLVPKDLPAGLDADDVVTLFRKKHEIDFEDENPIIKSNGQVLLDEKTQRNKTIDEVFTSFLDQKNIRTDVNGRGKGDDGNRNGKMKVSDIKSTDDFYTYVEQNEIKETDHHKVLAEVQKENSTFFLGQ